VIPNFWTGALMRKMRAILTLAGLTIQEALRRRISVSAFCIALLFLGLLFLPRFGAYGRGGIQIDPPVQASLLALTGLAMIKFFSAVLGITLASGAIATELERGTLYVILSKPLTRAQILLGKWLGLVFMIAVNVGVWGALVWLAVHQRVPGAHRPLLKALGLAFLYPVIFVTLTLCFSTFASNMLATALALVCIGVGWQEGFMLDLGQALDIRILRQFGTFAGYLVPIGRLHRWMIQVADLDLPFGVVPLGPGSRLLHPGPMDLPYIGAYILGLLLLALVLFQQRDV
jgi:ABC-type transport system involved in multi-copper enzyme maturation permease subunit